VIVGSLLLSVIVFMPAGVVPEVSKRIRQVRVDGSENDQSPKSTEEVTK
jgi:hypothetical protein